MFLFVFYEGLFGVVIMLVFRRLLTSIKETYLYPLTFQDVVVNNTRDEGFRTVETKTGSLEEIPPKR